ncbi:MAG: hypothetical protein ACJ79K_06715 [Gemmatimonadaceae bacterium]
MEWIVALATKWSDEAIVLGKRGDERGSRLLDALARELVEAVELENEQPLTLRDASKYSGYSEDHLGRLVRHGKLENVGRPGAPRVRRRNVPKKATAISAIASTSGQSDNVAILVRDIATSMIGA